MVTAKLRIGTLAISLLLSLGLAGRAAAQPPVATPPYPPWNGRQDAFPPGGAASAPGQTLTDDCDKHRGPIRGMLHRAHCKRCMERKLLGFREEFNEWPLGAALYANCQAQVANGDAARMTFYRYDFVDGTARLNIQGMDKLQEIKAMLPMSFAPVLVERTPARPTLADARRAMLLAELSRGEFPVPKERVVVGKPIPIGRGGSEAAIISTNQMMGVLSGTGFRTGMMMGAGGGMGGGGMPTGFDMSGMTGNAVLGGQSGGMGSAMVP